MKKCYKRQVRHVATKRKNVFLNRLLKIVKLVLMEQHIFAANNFYGPAVKDDYLCFNLLSEQFLL